MGRTHTHIRLFRNAQPVPVELVPHEADEHFDQIAPVGGDVVCQYSISYLSKTKERKHHYTNNRIRNPLRKVFSALRHQIPG
jgi:hypothetical protein